MSIKIYIISLVECDGKTDTKNGLTEWVKRVRYRGAHRTYISDVMYIIILYMYMYIKKTGSVIHSDLSSG